MYSFEKMEILKKFDRDEIIEMGLNLNDLRAIRFVSTYKLSSQEIQLFKDKYKNFKNVLNAIAYYQEGDKDVYKRR